ncbi:MAG: class I SAM-dependent methyltransferase [bacterium]
MTTLASALEPAGVPPEEIPKIYTRLAPMYDFWARLTESRARELAVAHVRDGEHVLEVAVGTGLAFETLVHANPHGRTEGVDLTPAMLERARRKVRGLPGKHALSIARTRARCRSPTPRSIWCSTPTCSI